MFSQLKGYFPSVLIIAFIISNSSCRHLPGEGTREGKVVYEVTYPDTLKNGPFAAFLPKEMTLYFKDDKTNAEFKAGMGVVTTRFMSDAGERKFSTMLKAFGKKSVMIFDEAAVKKNFLDRVNLKLEETGKTKQVAGLTCREVNVTDSTDHTYQVYYTEDIGLDDPNWCTPFREIEGLMLEYSVKVNNIVMNLKAKAVVFEKVDSLHFTVPADYEVITDPKKFRAF